MTDLLPAPAWQYWHSQYLQSERLSGSRHNYTSISGNQARYGHSEIHCCSILRTNSTWFTFSISPVFPFPRIWCIQSVSRIHSQPQQPLRAVQQNLKLRSMLMSLSHLLLTFYEFQFSIYNIMSFAPRKIRKLLSAHPVVSKYLLSISWWGQLISPNLHLSSLQIPDPHPASNLFSFLNQQNFLSTIDILWQGKLFSCLNKINYNYLVFFV